jgi:K+/H+ antiporter YhaU regulatory subunit KhtT
MDHEPRISGNISPLIRKDINPETKPIHECNPPSLRSIKELKIRSTTSARMNTVKRGNGIIPSPGLEFVFAPGNILSLIEGKERLSETFALLESWPPKGYVCFPGGEGIEFSDIA